MLRTTAELVNATVKACNVHNNAYTTVFNVKVYVEPAVNPPKVDLVNPVVALLL
jgi:hypothetical protein